MPGIYQQSSFLVITFTVFGMTLGPHHLFAVIPQYSALINNLIVTTDRFIMDSCAAPSSRSSSQEMKPRIAPAPLAWSVALRTSRDITMQASIEYVVCLSTLISFIYFASQDWATSWVYRPYGQARAYFPLGYWRNLWSNFDFADQPLKSCVNIIHVDIVEIWNLFDRLRVCSPQFPPL